MLDLNLKGVVVIILSNPGLLLENKPEPTVLGLKQNLDDLFILKTPKMKLPN